MGFYKIIRCSKIVTTSSLAVKMVEATTPSIFMSSKVSLSSCSLKEFLHLRNDKVTSITLQMKLKILIFENEFVSEATQNLHLK